MIHDYNAQTALAVIAKLLADNEWAFRTAIQNFNNKYAATRDSYEQHNAHALHDIAMHLRDIHEDLHFIAGAMKPLAALALLMSQPQVHVKGGREVTSGEGPLASGEHAPPAERSAAPTP